MIVSTVLAFIGIIVLFTSNAGTQWRAAPSSTAAGHGPAVLTPHISVAVKFNTPRSCDGQPSCPNVRAAVFDSAMYTIWALIFGFSGFLCDVASVLTAMIFYLTCVAQLVVVAMVACVSCVWLRAGRDGADAPLFVL